MINVRFKALGTVDTFDQSCFQLSDGATLKDLMDMLIGRYGAEAVGGLLTVNAELVYEDEAAQRKLRDGDEVLLAPPLSGG